MEIWKPIRDFARYEASSLGRIRSIDHVAFDGSRRSGRILKSAVTLSSCGKVSRLHLNLRRDGKSFSKFVHRLVLETFVGPCPENMEGCHNDGNPRNNRLSNLRWDTHEANRADMLLHGTTTKPPVHRGEAHPQATLSDEQVAEIRSAVYERGIYSSLARRYGVAPITIRRLYKGESRA